jgi:hypothetical protein
MGVKSFMIEICSVTLLVLFITAHSRPCNQYTTDVLDQEVHTSALDTETPQPIHSLPGCRRADKFQAFTRPPSLQYAPQLAAPITGMIIALNIGERLIQKPATPLPLSILKS